MRSLVRDFNVYRGQQMLLDAAQCAKGAAGGTIGVLHEDLLIQQEGCLRKFITKNTLVVFDLDGTLAPIISSHHYQDIPEVRHLCSQSCLCPVACYYRRSRNYALQYLGFDPDT